MVWLVSGISAPGFWKESAWHLEAFSRVAPLPPRRASVSISQEMLDAKAGKPAPARVPSAASSVPCVESAKAVSVGGAMHNFSRIAVPWSVEVRVV